MMRFLISSVLLLVHLGSIGTSQALAQRNEARTSTKAELELTNHIIQRKYCSGGGMLLILQLKYKNIGEDRLILFRHAMPPFEYRISRSKEAAGTKRYEQVISPMMGSSPNFTKFGDEPPSDYFVVLEPGQSFTPVNNVTVPMFIAGAGKDSSEYLGPGDHVLQLKISTWPFDNKLETDLQSRWQRFGTLWTKPVLSLPMNFQIERPHDRSPSDCNPPTKSGK